MTNETRIRKNIPLCSTKNSSNCHDAFEDDFDVDTQVLQDVERMAMNSQPNDQKPKCKIIGIPLVEQSILKKRRQMRLEQEANLQTKNDTQSSMVS